VNDLKWLLVTTESIADALFSLCSWSCCAAFSSVVEFTYQITVVLFIGCGL